MFVCKNVSVYSTDNDTGECTLRPLSALPQIKMFFF